MYDDDDATRIAENVHQHEFSSKPLWWRRPSPWWFLCLLPLSTIADNAVMAPRVEILTLLACEHHRPEYMTGYNLQNFWDPDPPEHIMTTLNVSSAYVAGFWSASLAAPQTAERMPNNGTATAKGYVTNAGPDIKRCRNDSAVQKAVAKLNTSFTIVIGLLGAVTIGWWGAVSDRIGRTRVIAANIFGAVVVDITFILVSLFSKRLPGGYWFIMVGPVVEGVLGGLGAAGAIIAAYISDTTAATSRARYLSLMLGTIFVGMAIGPVLGSIIRRATSHPLSVFYFSTVCHAVFALITWTILPESVSKGQMQALYLKRTPETRSTEIATTVKLRMLSYLRSVLGFVRPLSIILPTRVQRQRGMKNRDWTLTLVALGYMVYLTSMGAGPYVIQYAQANFGWTSEEVGYMTSGMGATRVLCLTIIVPFVLTGFKSKMPPIQLPLEASQSPDPSALEEAMTAAPTTMNVASHAARIDLALARTSLLIECVAFSILTLATTGFAFTVPTILSSLGAGTRPALQSLALDAYTRRGGTEAGRLFAALSVLQALGTSILGPLVFGFVYILTVERAPWALFVAVALMPGIAFAILLFVPYGKGGDAHTPEVISNDVPDEREPLIDTHS